MKSVFILFFSFILEFYFYEIVNAQLLEPTRDSAPCISNPTNDVIWFPYTPVTYSNGSFEIYYINGGYYKLARSTNGSTWTNVGTVSSPAPEAIVTVGTTRYMGYHDWTYNWNTGNYVCSLYTATSTNGLTFTPANKGNAHFQSGEDISFTYNSDSAMFYSYIRPVPSTNRRMIGFMKSPDFEEWTDIDTILKVDIMDFNNPSSIDYRDQFYNMSVVRNGTDWWGLVNVLHNNDNGPLMDTEQEPVNGSYEGENDQTVEVQLVHSYDGIKWKRTNNRLPFITRADGIKQCYGLPTIVDDELWIYSVESKRRHTTYDNANHANKWYSIWRYKISISDLNEWRPSTILKLKAPVQGFYKISTGTFNFGDTLTVNLRNSVSPYNIVRSSSKVFDAGTQTAYIDIGSIAPGNYYIQVEGRNSLKTWSIDGGEQFITGDTVSYDFSGDITQAYGNNLVFAGQQFCLYSGDINSDDVIDAVDVSSIDNHAFNFTEGYIPEDITGDLFVDVEDLAIASDNAANSVMAISP